MQQIKHIRIRESWNLEPQTIRGKWLFQLDDSKPFVGKSLFHQTFVEKPVVWSSRTGMGIFFSLAFFLFQIVLKGLPFFDIRMPNVHFLATCYHRSRNDPIQLPKSVAKV